MTSLSKAKFKPMLAQGWDVDLVTDLLGQNIPLVVETKIDGVRLIIRRDAVTYRTGKRIRNKGLEKYILERVASIPLYPFILEGEIVVNHRQASSLPDTTSLVNTKTNTIDLKGMRISLFLFNLESSENLTYDSMRHLMKAIAIEATSAEMPVALTPSTRVGSVASIERLAQEAVDQDEEGIMIKRIDRYGVYGRSRHGHLMRYVTHLDTEGEIVAVQCRYHNPLEKDGNVYNQGRKPVDRHQLRPTNELGKLTVKTKEYGIVRIGSFSGLTKPERVDIYTNKENYIGRMVTFRHQLSYRGKVTKARLVSFRPDLD